MPFYFIKNFDEKRPCQDSQIPETILRLLPGDYVGNDACNAVVSLQSFVVERKK